MNPQQIKHLKHETLEAFENNACNAIMQCANKSIALKQNFSIVLCGGNTPKGIFKKLVNQQTDWSKWHIYFGDERCLDEKNPARNSLMADEAWLNLVPIPGNQKHIIQAELGPEIAAKKYEELLSAVTSFDLVLLGFGEDGHIASLFPGHHWNNDKSVVPVDRAPKPPTKRVSLTPSRLSKTKKIFFLVTGQNKQIAFNQWLAKKDLPASKVCAEDEIKIFSFDLT